MNSAQRNPDMANPKFMLAPSAIPEQVIRMESPEYIAARLAEPVAAKQLWLAKDAGAQGARESQYVLVLTVGNDERTVTIVPMSSNVAERTEGALSVDRTPMGLPMIAWPDLATEIPVRLLYKPLDAFDDAVFRAVTGNRANARVGVRRTQPVAEPTVSSERRFLAMRRKLDRWHAICAQLPALHGEETLRYSTSDALAAYNDALKTVLHLTPQQRIALSRGGWHLDDEQRQAMADAGFPDAPHRDEIIGDDYLIMAEQPRWRAAAEALAGMGDASGFADTDPRVRLAHQAQFALAARTSGHGRDAMEGAFEQASSIILGRQQRQDDVR
ncbi:hypothetical protein [Bifidobacterium biavatii]|uniref:Uncharacterized protein n=1 Tax=Bifidobacterium biavatii DSM 23969 TaxID=1437608 RepID=A0A087A0D3_9BIFI|nr:hypothetical protein [Bifidobacterium biavatii]KFI52233.1 hypothetical protein BBIA_0528 [Bifidobacterium biavatii DSM 23969]